MKLVRFGPSGSEQPGILDEEGEIRSLEGVIDDIAGDVLLMEGLRQLRTLDPQLLPVVPTATHLAPPVGEVGKVIGIGLNYADHAAESGMEVPSEPVLFMKATSSICGPHDDVVLPRGATKTDWEVELGVVIGEGGTDIGESDALDAVAGFCVVNDVSERAFQFESSGQWVKGKSADTFCPLGPFLVTTDEVPDPTNLDLWLDLNGERKQSGSTRTMVFGVAALVAYVSGFMSLHPGDIISTGTPPGVAFGSANPRWLRPGDVMRLGIDGLGVQEQRVVATP